MPYAMKNTEQKKHKKTHTVQSLDSVVQIK